MNLVLTFARSGEFVAVTYPGPTYPVLPIGKETPDDELIDILVDLRGTSRDVNVPRYV